MWIWCHSSPPWLLHSRLCYGQFWHVKELFEGQLLAEMKKFNIWLSAKNNHGNSSYSQVVADGLLGGKKGLGATKSCSSLVETIRFGRREKNDLDHLAELLVGAGRLEWGWYSRGTEQDVGGGGDHRGHDGEADFVQLSITTCLNPLMGWGLKSGICHILLILQKLPLQLALSDRVGDRYQHY